MLDTILFYSFALLTLVGAILTVSLRNAVYCAIALVTSLPECRPVPAAEGRVPVRRADRALHRRITVLFLFVIMLVNLDQTAHQPRYHRHWLVPLAATAGVGALFVAFLTRGRDLLALPAPRQAEAGGNVEQLADMLFRDYLVPFEVASLLLLVAIVGSVMMAGRRFDAKPEKTKMFHPSPPPITSCSAPLCCSSALSAFSCAATSSSS